MESSNEPIRRFMIMAVAPVVNFLERDYTTHSGGVAAAIVR